MRKSLDVIKITIVVLGSVAFVLLVAGAFIYYKQFQLINKSDRIEGSVVDLVRVHSAQGEGYAPVVEYICKGEKYKYTSKTASYPARYARQEKVMLFVDREHPEQVLIDTFVDRWTGIIILGIMTLIFGCCTLFLLFVERKS